MTKQTATVYAISSLALMLALAERAEAACDTTGTDKAYGDFWVERASGSCNCEVKQRKYDCVASGGFRAEGSIEVVATVTGGSCSVPCELTSGYDTAVATAIGNWAASATNYECDSVFTDDDQDGYGVCIDEDDNDPRKWVKINVNERICDGVDNDNDGTVDDGFTACPEDHKRFGLGSLYQGNSSNGVNLTSGALRVRQNDVVAQGPFGPLHFTRTYNSRRNVDDVGLGKGFTHNYSVYLNQMPSGDGRWKVLLPNGENQYFRCQPIGDTAPFTDDAGCVIDDHHVAGNLRRSADYFYFYPGDGTRYRFHDTPEGDVNTGRRYWDRLEDGAGNAIAIATFTTISSKYYVQKVEAANSSIYLHFTYSSSLLDLIRVNSTSSNLILDYGHASSKLDTVKFSSSFGTIDDDTQIKFSYDANDNLNKLESKLTAGGALITTASFTHDGSDRVTAIEDASKDFAISYSTAMKPAVTYELAIGNTTTSFTHNGLWVTDADSDIRVGGISGAKVVYDEHGRTKCLETDDSRMYKYTYGDSTAPTVIDEYGKTGSCTDGLGSILHKTWLAWQHNSNVQALRLQWSRTKSAIYSSPPSSCTGASPPAGCRETKYDYVSSTDDRIQWVTRTGYTKNVADTVSQQIRKQRMFYFGLDTSICTSGDAYSGLVCRAETQDNSGTVFARADYLYEPSGATAGLLKATKRYKSSSASLDTQFASHTPFGAPGTMTDERGMLTTYAYNGWGGLTSVTQTDAMKDDSAALIDPQTQYSYTKLRTLDTVTLPKGNKTISKYFTGATDYARLKAFALADSSSNLTEILRYDNDKFGRRVETKIIDSINGTTPCSDEDCATLETRNKYEYDAIGRIKKEYLYTSDTSDPSDGSQTWTYASGKLDTITDALGNVTDYDYDDQGRASKISRDEGGIDAETTFTYDGEGQLLTTTSPTGVVTRTEHNDFGEVVLERSQTRGDLREEFDVAGRTTKRRESQYNSSSSAQDHCWTYDWLSRKTEYDRDCNASVNTNLYYDEDSLPGSACETGADFGQGRLTMHTDSTYKRVLCYHKNGRLHSSYQVMGTSTWSNSTARGTALIYDLNGNIEYEYLEDRPDNTDHARKINYVYDSTLKDRIQYIRHKLTSAGSWTLVTSDSTNPTYFSFGGFKTIKYANNIVETNEYDKARRLTRRKTDLSSPATTYADLNLTYDIGGRITHYDDHLGKRHLEYYTAYDDLNRLRCVGRTSISSCSGVEPWGQENFLESFDYDKSGNRTFRRYGAFATDDDEYTYVTGTDVIDKVNVAGTDKQMSNTVEGELTEVNTPANIAYSWTKKGDLSTANNNFLGDTVMAYTDNHDLFQRTAVCNSRKNWYFYQPSGAGGATHQVRVQDAFNTCAAEFPRNLRSYVYIEGRPIAALYSTRASGTDDQTEGATYWIHTDQLGTPILVTDSSGVERWRWENDPFGRNAPMDFTVSGQDVNPDDDPANGGADNSKYNTCCCDSCGNTGCNDQESSCGTDCCLNDAEQDVIWSKTYTVSGANNIRLHFSTFDVAEGATRTGKDYVRLKKADNTLLAELTGNLGAHWTQWAGEGESSMKIEFVADNTQDNTRGFVVDQLEYTTSTNGRFVLDLRMPGQVWDAEAYASYNFRRWYRSEDGRYVSPDPIGLEGGEAGYFGYVGGDPMGAVDPSGLDTNAACSHSGLTGGTCNQECPTCTGVCCQATGGLTCVCRSALPEPPDPPYRGPFHRCSDPEGCLPDGPIGADFFEPPPQDPPSCRPFPKSPGPPEQARAECGSAALRISDFGAKEMCVCCTRKWSACISYCRCTDDNPFSRATFEKCTLQCQGYKKRCAGSVAAGAC